MGCSASRQLAEDDAVRLCRHRRRHMREAVSARRRLAGAQSAYLRSLRRVGAALSRFSALHSLLISEKTPPVLLSSAVPVRPPPPPPPPFSPSPPPSPVRKGSKLSPRRVAAASRSESAAWNWEDFYPPSPPGSVSSDGAERRHFRGEVDGSVLQERLSEDDEEFWCRAYTSTPSLSGAAEETEEVRSESCDPLNRQSGTGIFHGEEESTGMVVVLKHRNLKEIALAVEEFFVIAVTAGKAAADLLDAGSTHLNGGLRQNNNELYCSSSLLSSLTSFGSSRHLAVQYEMNGQEDAAVGKSHCSTLDRLFAWEKKLYEEVKAREGAKSDCARQLSKFQTQEKEGADATKLDKTKASIQQLQSVILTTSKATSTTMSAIVKSRDEQLAPQLIELCHGFLQMWRSMNQCHEAQNNIVQQVQGLVNISPITACTDVHRQATRDLESAMYDWHSTFLNLIKFQRVYIRALYNWLKLTLAQISNELPEDHYSSLISSELTSFCNEWKQVVDKVPDAPAAEAINSFASIVHSIYLKQKEELKIKTRVELLSKELDKKTLALRNMETKYYRSYSEVNTTFSNGRFNGQGQVLDESNPLLKKKEEVTACRRKVEDEMARHARAIWATREVMLSSIQSSLPSLFQAMVSFSSFVADALEDVYYS